VTILVTPLGRHTTIAPRTRLARKVLSVALGMGRRTRRGFTLVELMIVVAIVSVLAAIAVFAVQRYLFAAKSSEAINMIGSIKSAQEAYKDETFTYLDVTGDIDSFYPQSPVGKREKVMWGGDGPGAGNWKTLGVTTNQPVQYGYACVAGAAGTSPPSVGTTPETTWPSTDAITGPWYVVKAIGDQDGDSEESIFVGSSFTTEIYVEKEAE
jgi:type IV pilus assembly protein PilA